MGEIRRICVFCGSRTGHRPEYRELAVGLGSLLAEKGIGLVYGGGNVGLMGVVADAALAAGGTVIGVIPRVMLEWEVGHEKLTRLEIVDSMHARKARMAELADAFIALPGGLGTFEELFEILTWAQLGFHTKPIGLIDTCNYYAPLVQLLERGVEEGFMKPENRQLLLSADDAPALLRAMAQYHTPVVAQRIRESRQL